MFAIVDVETTGGYAEAHRVIEVGIAISDGQRIIERYNQLVNPERVVPNHIIQLTGISNDDVIDKPTFAEIASEVYDLLQGQVFIAHNVNFDYTFIQRELEQAGYTWKAKKGCTVRLTRSIIPGLKSYSLANLAAHFNIVNPNPHRALADAETAADILHELIQTDEDAVNRAIHKNTALSQLPVNLDAAIFHSLPEVPGVYYMLGKNKEILYIGKAVNIKQRISQHFTGSSGSKRRQRWLREVYHINTVKTGSEALALLHEDHEIRQHWPPYNSAQKHPVAKWGIVSYRDRKNIVRFAVQRAEKRIEVLEHFYSYTSAQQYLAEAVKERGMNAQYSGLGWESEVDINTHQEAAEAWLREFENANGNVVLNYPGVDVNEFGFVLIREGKYAGIGFAPKNAGEEDLEQYVWHKHDSPTAQQIVRSLLRVN